MVSKRSCMRCLNSRTPLEKTLLSLSSLLLLTLLLLIFVGFAYRGNKSDNPPDDRGGCWTRNCIQIAGDVLSGMEPASEPCEDFYSLACGRYGADQGRASSVAKQSIDSAYFALKNLQESTEVDGSTDDTKNFYNSCVQFGSYRPKVGVIGADLLDLMSKMGIGVWPILDPLYDTESFILENTLVSLVLLDVPVVFRMEVIPDQQIDGSYLIKISPGGPHESGRSPSDIRADVQLRSSVLTALLLLGASAGNTNTDVNDILSVESSFAAIEQDTSMGCELNQIAPDEAVSELKRLIPEINWAYVLPEIRRRTGLQRSSFAVHLHCKEKIRDYVNRLNDLAIRSATNYLGWRFFFKFVEHIIPTFDKSRFGSDEALPRWRVCLELMEKSSPPLLTKTPTNHVISKEVQKEVEKIANATLISARQFVSRAGWLSPAQKRKILEKVSLLQIRLPILQSRPGEAQQPQIDLSQVYVSNFTSAVLQLQLQWVIGKFKKLVQDSEAAAFSWAPLVSPEEGSDPIGYTVPIYLDKIQSPYIRPHASEWMNFGGFGVSVARQLFEVMMTFLSDGGAAERNGTFLWEVWANDFNSGGCVLKSFAARHGINIESLSQAAKEDVLHYIFVEHSSLEIAYESAKSSASPSESLPGLDWSDQKMFFLAHAQSLCDVDAPTKAGPNSMNARDRFNAALSGFSAFGEVFSCAPSPSQCQRRT